MSSRAPARPRRAPRTASRGGPSPAPDEGRVTQRRAVKPGRRGWWHTTLRQPRLVVLLAVIMIMFTGLFVRVAELQTVSPERYVALGEQQRVRSVDLPAARGSLLDRNGEDLALSVNQPTFYADPGEIADPVAVAAHLAPALGMDQTELTEKLSEDSNFVYLARQVTDEMAADVRELDLPGIHEIDEPERFNPGGDLARSVIGTVGVDNTGLSGIEAEYEQGLTGTPGELTIERNPAGNTISSGEHHLTPAEQGDDLVLTLDRGLQFEAERALAAQVDATGALGGVAVIMRPGTGEILAMANVDATINDDGSRGPAVPSTNNRAVTAVYEPGSVNKVVTLAAAIEEGVVEPGTRFQVPDSYPVADHTFTDHDPHAIADWSVADILTQSSNVGTIMVAQQLGAERLDDYLHRFGFGDPTALDFPHEAAGLMLPLDDWSGTSIGSIPIGQGISVTALQMLEAFNVIANDGVYVPPRLVDARIDGDGERHDAPAAETHRVVSDTTARQVNEMMVSVVNQGTGTSGAIDGYQVAGKTGTARKPQDTGGYEDAAGNYHYVATFAGFVPAEDPQLSMIVVLDEPTSSIYGGEVSAPVFAHLAQYALSRYRIPPPAQVGPQPVVTQLATDPAADGLGSPVPSDELAAPTP